VQVQAQVGWYEGPRVMLRPMFELAEDSVVQLDAYVDLGRVLVARRDDDLAGHLQLVPTDRTGEIELKNMAVVPAARGIGVGRALVAAAVAATRAEGWQLLLVATGAADVGNLRFYQRVGFRLLSIDRDAFTPATGYPEPIVIDGIELRDRVWLSLDLTAVTP
jgi:GNAT superfamily N-acetyltransferase